MTNITLSKDKMKRSEIPEYLKAHNLQLANWDECVKDKEFLAVNENELKMWFVWVDSKNLKKINTNDLYVSNLALESSKNSLPVVLFYDDFGRLGVYAYGFGPYYAARVAVKPLEKASAKSKTSKEVLSRTKGKRFNPKQKVCPKCKQEIISE